MKSEEWYEYSEKVPELLPCPFCGRKPEAIEETEDGAAVECKYCDFKLYHNGPHLVAGAWNTRWKQEEATILEQYKQWEWVEANRRFEVIEREDSE